MKKFLLGVAVGALVSTLLRVQVQVVKNDEDDAEDGAEVGQKTASSRDRAAVPPEVQDMLARVRDRLRASIANIEAGGDGNLGCGPDCTCRFEVLTGDEASAYLDKHLPGLREQLFPDILRNAGEMHLTEGDSSTGYGISSRN